MDNLKRASRIAIVGVGQVGAAAAYALVLGSIADELLLVDTRAAWRDGQVRDLSDAAYASRSKTRVYSATYREASQCDIVVITAGSKYLYGQTSMDYLYRNTSIVRSIINEMKPFRSDTVLLIVANPVDLMTSLAKELSNLPSAQVLGSGTFLDSIRLRGLLADETGLAPNSLDLYVLGTHGDSAVAAWSCAAVGGVPLKDALGLEKRVEESLVEECKHRSQSIVRAKGATTFGIGSIVCSICASVLLDRHNVRPVSHYQPQHGCCFSLPAVLGRKGIVQTFPVPLSAAEQEGIAQSVGALKSTLNRVLEEEKGNRSTV
ncbi:protein ldhA [Aspergillus nidulans FGSC A4]|uniref:L-lactate dehydrogenase n=1 Tax=Emericella nidulans (strain FGSC A4 / ATCC 38163 / CBS 112.46 / NRRL 194 / M139) TaxID=227321 RepID=C8V017_EMENI|nr:protein ldhA [Aspergillus nidulans FGSC A4]CBF70728.1 TPA: hypothetical protein similar to L-lactate dehydrogenase (Eurofung) [Aspergillus nidulans FGSC A4]